MISTLMKRRRLASRVEVKRSGRSHPITGRFG